MKYFFLLFLFIMSISATPILVPDSSLSTNEGNTNFTLPFNQGTSRYQALYSASLFGSQPLTITHMRLRQGTGGSVENLNVTDMTIQISTSQNTVANIDTTFANNIGSDVVDVITPNSNFNLTFPGGSIQNSPNSFAEISLLTPFNYDPSMGDLLIDFITAGTITNILDLDSTNNFQGVATGLFGFTDTSLTGFVQSSTIIIEFEVSAAPSIPEPSTYVLLLLTMFGLGFLKIRA